MSDGRGNPDTRYPPMLWQLDALPEFGRTLKQYDKKSAPEVAQLLVNLDAVHQALNL